MEIEKVREFLRERLGSEQRMQIADMKRKDNWSKY
jgi:hypothetical protein